MSRRVPFPFKPQPLPGNQIQGPIVLDIHITVDGKGLMQTEVTGNPLPGMMQVVSALVDSLKGYMDILNKQASMIINPNRTEEPPSVEGEQKINGGEKAEDHHNG